MLNEWSGCFPLDRFCLVFFVFILGLIHNIDLGGTGAEDSTRKLTLSFTVSGAIKCRKTARRTAGRTGGQMNGRTGGLSYERINTATATAITTTAREATATTTTRIFLIGEITVWKSCCPAPLLYPWRLLLTSS